MLSLYGASESVAEHACVVYIVTSPNMVSSLTTTNSDWRVLSIERLVHGI